MKWITYQIVQSTVGEEDILITKKVGYSEANLAIAEAEAYNGYTIEDDEKAFSTTTEFPGDADMTGHKIKNLGEPTDDSDAATLGKTKELISPVKNDVAVIDYAVGSPSKNLFNANGEINSIYSGTIITDSSANVVNGNVITLNRSASSQYPAGQFIKNLKDKKIIVSFDCVNLAGATNGTIRIYRRGVAEPIFSEYFGGIKRFTYAINISYDEVLVSFGTSGTLKGVQIKNVMVRYADITDDTYEEYKPSVNERLIEAENDIAINRATLGTWSKNCLEITATSKTAEATGGLTITVNDDKSITINGTVSSNYKFVVGTFAAREIKKHLLSGCPSGGGGTTYQLFSENTEYNIYNYANNSVAFTPKTKNKQYFSIIIYKNVVCDNLTFYPMIRSADITDDNYEPYKPSVNERLVEAESDIAENAESIEELDKNKQNFTFGYTYSSGSSTAGWYKLAQCVFTPSSENIVRDTTLYIDYLNNTSNQLNETKACILKAEVRASTGGIKGVKLTSLINNGVTADNIVLVAQHKEGVVTAELWTKISSTYSGWRATIISNSERAANHNYGDEGFWVLGKTQYRYDSYSDYSYKAFPTDYYGDIIKGLSDRITALETAYTNLAKAAQEGANSV